MTKNISKQEIEKKYKTYNTIYQIMCVCIFLIFLVIIFGLINAYNNGIPPIRICFDGGCDKVYGISAFYEYYFYLIIFSIGFSPIIFLFLGLFIFVIIKRNEYKKLLKSPNT